MTPRRNQRRRARVSHSIQSLEPRRLLAVIDCTNAADTIRLFVSGGTQHVEVNGFDLPVGDANITINALGGNDNIIVAGTRAGSTITVNGGEGNDALSNTLADLDACYPGTFTFDGGNGDDSFTANNSADVGATAILLQPNGIVRTESEFLVHYANVDRLTYLDSNASNDIRFINLVGPQVNVTHLTINGNGGDDVISNYRFSDFADMATSFASVSNTIDAGAGNDALRLSNATFGALFTIAATTMTTDTLDLVGPLTYAAFEAFELLGANNSGDIVRLNGKPGAMSMLVESQGGNDIFEVGAGDLDSSGLRLSNTTLLGGTGNDEIRVDDRLDAESVSETETYTMEINSLAKGGGGFVYGGFDAQSIQLADRINGAVLIGNTVNLNAIQGTIASTTLTGGATRDTTVNFAQGNLLTLSGSFNVDLGSASGTIVLNDQNDTGNDNYIITDAQVTKTVNSSTQVAIAYQNVLFVTVNANVDGNGIFVQKTRANRPIFVNAGGGNDSIRLGNGNVGANLLGPVNVNGGAGTNELLFNNMNDAAPGDQTLNGTTFTDGDVTHNASSVSSVIIENGTGGGTLDILRSTVFTFASSSSFDQTINIGGGNLDANLLADVSIGTAGTVTVDDRLDVGNDGYLVNLLTFRKTTLNARSVSMNNVTAAILQCNAGHNAVQVSNGGNLLRLFGNGGNDNFTVADTVPFLATETVSIDTGSEQASLVEPFGDYVTVNSDAGTSGDAPARVRLLNDDLVLRLTVNAAGVFQIPTNVVCLNAELNLAGGVLDLAGGALLNRGGVTLTQFRRFAQIGHNAGAWNGIDAQQGSINSSLAASSPRSDAVGYAPSTHVALAQIGSFPIVPGDTLVRYTLSGDANLDGNVNLADFNVMVANFGQSPRHWFEGDFSYDGTANLDDFNLLAGNFGSALALPEIFAPRG